MTAVGDEPWISVVMPVRNGEQFLQDALGSLARQTLDRFEAIVVDDGSTDETPAILASAAELDPRFRVVTGPPRGLAPALNHGLDLARAPIVARFDADDVMHPRRLEVQVGALAADLSLAVLAGGFVRIDADGRPLGAVTGALSPEQVRETLLHRNPIAHPTVAMRRDIVLSVGGYRFDQAEDYDLWLRIAERHPIAILPVPVIDYRMHAGQFSVARLVPQAVGALAVRAAAAHRREGRSDPLAGVDRLTCETLELLGVPPDVLRGYVRQDAIHWARVLRTTSDAVAADRLLVEAAVFCEEPQRRLRSELLLDEAVESYHTGRVWHAARSLTGAITADPSTGIGGGARRLLRGRSSR
jgi:GT2 family glycosyltransferase